MKNNTASNDFPIDRGNEPRATVREKGREAV